MLSWLIFRGGKNDSGPPHESACFRGEVPEGCSLPINARKTKTQQETRRRERRGFTADGPTTRFGYHPLGMNSRLSAASAEFRPGFGAGSNGNDSQAEAEARQSAENRLRTAITRKAERLATTKHVINLGLVPSQGPLEEGGFPMTM
jgi:hypothetical protein